MHHQSRSSDGCLLQGMLYAPQSDTTRPLKPSSPFRTSLRQARQQTHQPDRALSSAEVDGLPACGPRPQARRCSPDHACMRVHLLSIEAAERDHDRLDARPDYHDNKTQHRRLRHVNTHDAARIDMLKCACPTRVHVGPEVPVPEGLLVHLHVPSVQQLHLCGTSARPVLHTACTDKPRTRPPSIHQS